MQNQKSREIRLKSRPTGMPTAANFELAETDVPTPGPGQVLVRNAYMTVDPYMRGRMMDRKSYVPPFQIGKPLEGGAVGQVVASNAPHLKVGDYVQHMLGWREWVVADGASMMKLDPAIGPIQAYLGALGMPGLTAYVGLLKIGELKDGERVFVSAASGAVGQIVCQIAKAKGCYVVGSVGSDEKADFILNELGVDKAINYKTAGDLTAAFKQAAPKGIDIYFDNVGGETLDAALLNMRRHGRIVVSGQISEYNAVKPRGIRYTTPFITQRLRMEGLVVYDYGVQFNEARAQMAEWVRAGKLSYREEIIEGIERTPEAFIGLFTGESFGRRLVHVGA